MSDTVQTEDNTSVTAQTGDNMRVLQNKLRII